MPHIHVTQAKQQLEFPHWGIQDVSSLIGITATDYDLKPGSYEKFMRLPTRVIRKCKGGVERTPARLSRSGRADDHKNNIFPLASLILFHLLSTT
jgi:hypothetical protein